MATKITIEDNTLHGAHEFGNPLAALDAILLALETGHKIPGWARSAVPGLAKIIAENHSHLVPHGLQKYRTARKELERLQAYEKAGEEGITGQKRWRRAQELVQKNHKDKKGHSLKVTTLQGSVKKAKKQLKHDPQGLKYKSPSSVSLIDALGLG